MLIAACYRDLVLAACDVSDIRLCNVHHQACSVDLISSCRFLAVVQHPLAGIRHLNWTTLALHPDG